MFNATYLEKCSYTLGSVHRSPENL